MIYLRNISLSFLDKVIFDRISWTIHPRSRIGLVGDNGTGKTTLFRAILEQVPLDDGYIEIPDKKQKKIGYLPQDLVELDNITVIDYLKQISGIAEMENSIRNLEEQIAKCRGKSDRYLQLIKKYDTITSLYSAREGYSFEAKSKQILKGLGFKQHDPERNCSDFSGGWKMRILLSGILLMRPDIILLDEPTNHLDTESMEWLESFLKDYKGTIIAISHDRFFLDKIALQIAELSSGHIHIYQGNYSYYLQEKERRHEALKKEMELQKAHIKDIERFVERFRYKATKAAQVQSRIKMLEKYKEIKALPKTRNIVMRFPEGKKSAKEVVKVINLGHNYGNTKVFSCLNFTLFRGDKVAFVGVNGSGKSTLSRLLGLTEKPSCGVIQYGDNVRMALFSQENTENLDYNKNIWEEISTIHSKFDDQGKRNLLGAFLFSGDDIFKPVSILSGGEKSRLTLLKIMLMDTNFLILDEPTNHLDIKTKDVFQEALIKYYGTIAIVSHDRYFLDCLVNKVFELKDNGIMLYPGNYSYFIEKRSLNNVNIFEHNQEMKEPQIRPANKTKEKKRLEAEERNRIYRIKSEWEEKLSFVEHNIQLLENKKSEYETFLCAPENLKKANKIKETQKTLKQVNLELEQWYHKWSEIEDKLINIK